jgi:hypothetical protein
MMGVATGYYRVSQDKLERMRQDKNVYISLVESDWEDWEEEKFFDMNKSAMTLAMTLDPTRTGVPHVDADSIRDMLLGEGGEIIHEDISDAYPTLLINQEQVLAALDEFEHLDKKVVKEICDYGILEISYPEEMEDTLFDDYFWPLLMEFKKFLSDVSKSGESLLMMISP